MSDIRPRTAWDRWKYRQVTSLSRLPCDSELRYFDRPFSSHLGYPIPHLLYPLAPGNRSVKHKSQWGYPMSHLGYPMMPGDRFSKSRSGVGYPATLQGRKSLALFPALEYLEKEKRRKKKRKNALRKNLTSSRRVCTPGLPYTHPFWHLLLYPSILAFSSLEVGRPSPNPSRSDSIESNYGQVAPNTHLFLNSIIY
jgi:hypothetical protein